MRFATVLVMASVIVTTGAKPIMFFTILALCEEGDEVLYPDPGFPMYESIVRLSGGGRDGRYWPSQETTS